MGKEIDAYCRLDRLGLYVHLVLIILTRKFSEAGNIVCAALPEYRLNVKNSAERHAKERETSRENQLVNCVSFSPLC